MLEFVNFDLPTDGLTTVKPLRDRYGDTVKSPGPGYTMVGIANVVEENDDGVAKAKPYGVWRMTSDEAVKQAEEESAAADKRSGELRLELSRAEGRIRELNNIIADLGEEMEKGRKAVEELARIKQEMGPGIGGGDV